MGMGEDPNHTTARKPGLLWNDSILSASEPSEHILLNFNPMNISLSDSESNLLPGPGKIFWLVLSNN